MSARTASGLLALLLGFTGCAHGPATRPVSDAPAQLATAPRLAFEPRHTLAVLPFEDTSRARWSTPWLSVWLADRTEHALRDSAGLKLVERREIGRLLEELGIGSGGLADPETALGLGELLGARMLVLGNFMRIGPEVRIDARVVDVVELVVAKAATVQGPFRDVHALGARLAVELAERLGVEANERIADAQGLSNLDAFRLYGEALEAEARGDLDTAIDRCLAALHALPDYPEAAEAVERLSLEAARR